MELKRVDRENYPNILRNTLKTLFSEKETNEIIEGLLYELEDGSFLYSIIIEDVTYGFIVVTPLSDNEMETEAIDLISIEDIFLKSGQDERKLADALCMQIKNLGKKLKVPQIEVIVSQSVSWLSESLQQNGFIPSEVKLEKLLPRSSNLEDVLELIKDCTPVDRIVQVLLEREDEFIAEFVEATSEITELIEDEWTPVMVVVTYEPEGSDIQKTIEESNQLINWDDYSVIYNI